MIPQRFFFSKSYFVIPAVIALLLAVACGSAATATPQAAVQPTAAPQAVVQPTVAPKAAVQPTVAPQAAVQPTAAPKAAVQPTAAPKAAVTKPFIADATFDPDRSRVPQGKLTVAYHTAITPKWLNPNEAPVGATAMNFMTNVLDPLISMCPGQLYCYQLAESYDMSQDFKTATFKLRKGVKFHDGTPLTTEDVKFTYENYHGPGAKFMQDKTESIEIVDPLTIKFHFKGPFFDFLVNYGLPATYSGWIMPKDYYLSLGPDNKKRDEAFNLKPIGTGPYKLVRQEPGISMEFEANTDYWRKVPHVKTYIIIGMPELPVRWAALKTGQVDIAHFITGAILKEAVKDPVIRLHPNNSAPFFLIFPDMDDPSSPFSKKEVRKAVSLAMDRDFLAQQETQGLALPWGNFVPPEWPGALQRPPDKFDLAEAKGLMAAAGYAKGFKLDWFTPFTAVESLGLRIMDELREIGISGDQQVMERPVYFSKMAEGKNKDGFGAKGFPGRQVVKFITLLSGHSSGYIEAYATCGGQSSLICVPEVQALWDKFLASSNLQEREELILKAQEFLLKEYIFVPIYVNAFTTGFGPRVAGDPDQYLQRIQHPFAGPPEDLRLK